MSDSSFLAFALAFIALGTVGCRGSNDPPPPYPVGDVGSDGIPDRLPWKGGGARSHPLLRDGVVIATWRVKGLSHGPVSHVLREGGTAHTILRPGDLRPFLREIRSPEDALVLSRLIRRLLGNTYLSKCDPGQMLRPIEYPEQPETPGGAGRYTRADAERWEVPFEPRIVEGKDDAYVLELEVLVYQDEAAEKRRRWQVVLMREKIGRDDTYQPEIIRVLEEDARRYGIRFFRN